MGGPSLFFRTDDRPLTEMTRKVRRALGKADTRELLETIGEEVAATTRRRFELGRDPDGGKWPMALSAREEGRKTLIKTGRLKDSYTYDVAPGGTSVEIGSNTKYAAIHHFGGYHPGQTGQSAVLHDRGHLRHAPFRAYPGPPRAGAQQRG